MSAKSWPISPILAVALCWLAIAANGTSAAAIDELDELLDEYRAGGLPEPPEGARLVRFWAGVSSDTRLYHLGFWIKPQDAGQPATILVGTRLWQVERE